jgi:hypothetical protein
MTQIPERVQPVDVRNFDMSFGRMVIFMVKWAIATIPALVILIAVGFAAVAFLGGFAAALKDKPEEAHPTAATFEQNSAATEPVANTATSDVAARPAQSMAPKRERPSEIEVGIARAKELLARGQYQQAYDAADAIKGATGLDAYTVESVKNQALNLSLGKIEHR